MTSMTYEQYSAWCVANAASHAGWDGYIFDARSPKTMPAPKDDEPCPSTIRSAGGQTVIEPNRSSR